MRAQSLKDWVVRDLPFAVLMAIAFMALKVITVVDYFRLKLLKK